MNSWYGWNQSYCAAGKWHLRNASLMMGGDGTGTDDRSVVDCECCSFIQ
jgi:hypothetical protein